MRKEINYNDGKLVLENGNMTAIGDSAHKTLFALYRYEEKNGFSKEKLEKIFDGINNCTIIV